MADEALSFAACQDLSANLATGYTLLYSLTDHGNGSCTLAGAFDRPASAPAWAAFGLPRCQQDCGMLHGSAVIARTCASCPTGARCCLELPAQLPASINAFYEARQGHARLLLTRPVSASHGAWTMCDRLAVDEAP